MNIKRKRRSASITTSSMSDIGFLLLIFIMLISIMNQRFKEPIEYSEAKQLQKTSLEHNFEIWIQKNGTISADRQNATPEILESLVVSAITEHLDVQIHIIADKNTPYKYINSVIQVLQPLQHRAVSFVAKEM